MEQKIKKQLKTQAHYLSPVIITGAHGLTPAVQKEIGKALESHELIKIRLNAEDRNERKVMIQEILEHHHAELIQKIGHSVSIYKKNELAG